MLKLICNDGTNAAVKLDASSRAFEASEVGHMIHTVVSVFLLDGNRTDPVEIPMPELKTADPYAAPLVAFLEGRFDVSGALLSSPEAVRACYEAANERLGAAGLVAAVERHVVALLDEGLTVPPALRGHPRIEALASNNNGGRIGCLLTHEALRLAVRGHSMLLLVLRGGTRAVTVFNLAHTGNLHLPFDAAAGVHFGGKDYLEYQLGRGHALDDADARIDAATGIPGSATGCGVLVFAGSGKADELVDDDKMGLLEPEFVINPPFRMHEIDAVVGFKPTEVVYTRDVVWKHVVM
ncbi:MAG: hypothetical protein B7Z66_15540 [Chromatiales bacterium 21-64-14]|nr:MAG: hypothetical protein B7Z66_15540 [Chromatiales bacterium 21-64-14]